MSHLRINDVYLKLINYSVCRVMSMEFCCLLSAAENVSKSAESAGAPSARTKMRRLCRVTIPR